MPDLRDINHKRPYPTPGYQIETLDEEIVLFHPAERKILYSNQTGALIWQFCDGQRSVEEIATLLSDAYPEVAQQVKADVKKTLLTFAQHGAITWR